MSQEQIIYIGTAGWSYKDWEGIVYPAQIKKSQHPVEYMARYLDVLEINTSFYGHVKPEHCDATRNEWRFLFLSICEVLLQTA